tara:strand:- start:1180 stop:1962 length:783 start_codon:yes stop_codon:yes gene_type:complete
MFNSPDPFIWVRDNLLPPDLCAEAIDRFEKDPRVEQGVIGEDAKYRGDVKRSDDLLISQFPEEWDDVDSFLATTLRWAATEYLADIHQAHQLKTFADNHLWKPEDSIFACLPYEVKDSITDSGFQIQRTRPHDRYDWHADNMQIWHENKDRQLTYIFYLNDVEEGGETEFMNGIRVKPKAGRMMLFPSTWTYVHRGRPPLGSTVKYLATGWISKCLNPFLPAPPQIEPQVNELEEDIEDDDGYEAPLSQQELTLDLTKLT